MAAGETHLNLIDSSAALFGLDPGASVENEDGWLFGAGRCENPAISNAAFRRDDHLDPAELLHRASDFFGERGRGFSLWVRYGAEADENLIAAATAAGFRQIHLMPEMVLEGPPERDDAPEETELRQVDSPGGSEDFWRVAESAYASNGFPPDVFTYDDPDGMRRDGIVAQVAYGDSEPLAIAMTIVSHGVAGIYWVGVVPEARGSGLGRTVTAAAVDAGLRLGAGRASLQASKMGEPIYASMGFRRTVDYALLLSPRPAA